MLRARQCLQALHAAFTGSGGEILEDVELVSVKSIESAKICKFACRVAGKAHRTCEISTKSLVLATGAWMGQLVHDVFQQKLPLVPWKVHVHYLALSGASRSLCGRLGRALSGLLEERLPVAQPVLIDYGNDYGEDKHETGAAADTADKRAPASVSSAAQVESSPAVKPAEADSSGSPGEPPTRDDWSPPHPVYSIPPLERPG